MFSDILQVFPSEDQQRLQECGVSAEYLDAAPDSRKEIFLLHTLVYDKLKNNGKPLNTTLKNIAYNYLNIGKTYINNIYNNINVENLKIKNFENTFLDIPPSLANFIKSSLSYIDTRKKIVRNLKSESYEHELDRQYLNTLKSTRGFDLIVKKISEYGIEPFLRVNYTGSNIKVTKNMMPDLYGILLEACEILEIDRIPDLYLQQGFINGCTIGDVSPLIVLDSIGVSILSRDELLFLIGHELGHIKSHHMLYHMMGDALPIVSSVAGTATLGLSNILTVGLNLALTNWHRMSEFTADRAGFLCCQNIRAVMSVFMKLSGLPFKYYRSCEAQIDAFIAQAEEFDAFDKSSMNKFIKYASILSEEHPWLIMRGKELLKWKDAGEYDRILNGCSLATNTPPAALETSSIFCSQCGTKCELGDKFCNSCGASL